LRKFKSRLARHLFTCVLVFLAITAIAQPIPTELVNGLKWRLIGPFRGGRAVAVAGVPGDSTTFYFGAVNGGIWKTTDAGVTWTPIFDGQPVGSIGALAVAPSDPKTIYAGTGESDIREDFSSGNGVYKSTDGGATWNHLGLEDTRQISRIVIDPQNPGIVYVGALGHAYAPNPQRGVYKSVDGGAGSRLGPRYWGFRFGNLLVCTAAPVCRRMAYASSAVDRLSYDGWTRRRPLPFDGCWQHLGSSCRKRSARKRLGKGWR